MHCGNTERHMMEKIKRFLFEYGFIFVIAVLFGVSAEYLQARNSPYIKEWIMPASSAEIALSGIRPVDYMQDGNAFEPLSIDPQLIIDTQGQAVRAIQIYFADPIRQDMECQVYYSNEENTFYAERMEPFFILGGHDRATAILPAAYRYIRIDINTDFRLDKLLVTGERPEEEPHTSAPYCVRNAVYWAVCAYLAGRAVRKRRALRGAVRTIGSFFRSPRCLWTILLGAVVCAVTGAAVFLVYRILGLRFNRPAAVFTALLGLTAAVILCFRTALAEKLEWFFLCAAAGLTLFFSLMMPATHLTWDLEWHYQYALTLSYNGTPVFTQADKYVIDRSPFEDITLLREDDRIFREKLNELSVSDNRFTVTPPGRFDYALYVMKHAGNIPNAAGLYLGRVFDLPFIWQYRLGRMMGALVYILIFFCAIRILPYGKTVLMCIGLFPTNLLMAASYAYDPMVTALIALGMAYFMRQYYGSEQPFRIGEGLKALFFMILGCLSKAVYFPLLFLTILVPKERFPGKGKKRLWRVLVLLAMGLLVVSFLLPFLSSAQAGDARGGSDVNAAMQIRYIFGNPLAYTKTLLGYLWNYLSVWESCGYIGNYAYLGIMSGSILLTAVLAAACFAERYPEEIAHLHLHQGIALFVSFGTICLVATALYISFTPVGADTINGCQGRYITPVLFPLLSFLHFRGSNERIDRRVFNGLVLGVFTAYNYYGLFEIALRYMQ